MVAAPDEAQENITDPVIHAFWRHEHHNHTYGVDMTRDQEPHTLQPSGQHGLVAHPYGAKMTHQQGCFIIHPL
ncbi:hypothetical protein BJV82DRAFT_597527 [Fennellomyces sp. T-0311]|nr:hypothetical protein BJV82DRAFT_638693 [Fennellomyces sp. T-0311]KAI8145413.1 hypothetical protein BJV82DRAFT_603580 [Fennellomyces sp. T-0311]KAI8147051.1 hypothetical protein BJV82DRAFT_597527 [Fennellomyces sp. T-0311]